MKYNWSKIVNEYPDTKVAVMNDEGDTVYMAPTYNISNNNTGGWTNNDNTGWSYGKNLYIGKRPEYKDSLEKIPEIYKRYHEEREQKDKGDIV